jgi:hypothetical protein
MLPNEKQTGGGWSLPAKKMETRLEQQQVGAADGVKLIGRRDVEETQSSI